jgi:hypothetical protein
MTKSERKKSVEAPRKAKNLGGADHRGEENGQINTATHIWKCEESVKVLK